MSAYLGIKAYLGINMDERPGCGAVSMGRCNTLVFFEGWSVRDEVSYADVLHGQTEVRDVGSVAARRVDEFDWKAF